MGGRRGTGRSSESGQALVEFAIVLPLLLLVLFGLIEFAFALNAASSVNYASRVAALLAAEGGTTEGTDCMVLRAVERALTTPTTPTRVSRVEIYWSDSNGDQIASNVNAYDRTGSLTCAYGDGSTITLPYARTTDNYPESERCDVLAGCGGMHTTVDDIGVRITYAHQWVTSFGQRIAPSLIFQRSTGVRMEPTL
ncbi:MAG TPA: TadE/TadG family type IV pilus assembly protein [Candidatus Limnocylindria bacterium]|jgi:Flp pilus assembly protein TadG|nr:TadE/TadG family type IV pilus assembly protein [Candidatus Limnocylindria bacterium]